MADPLPPVSSSVNNRPSGQPSLTYLEQKVQREVDRFVLSLPKALDMSTGLIRDFIEQRRFSMQRDVVRELCLHRSELADRLMDGWDVSPLTKLRAYSGLIEALGEQEAFAKALGELEKMLAFYTSTPKLQAGRARLVDIKELFKPSIGAMFDSSSVESEKVVVAEISICSAMHVVVECACKTHSEEELPATIENLCALINGMSCRDILLKAMTKALYDQKTVFCFRLMPDLISKIEDPEVLQESTRLARKRLKDLCSSSTVEDVKEMKELFSDIVARLHSPSEKEKCQDLIYKLDKEKRAKPHIRMLMACTNKGMRVGVLNMINEKDPDVLELVLEGIVPIFPDLVAEYRALS